MVAVIPAAVVIARIQQKHGSSVRLIGEYPGCVTARARFTCGAGHSWSAPTFRILRGHGCLQCRNTNLGLRYKTPRAEVEAKIAGRFKLIGDYTNMNAKADFLCLGCNREVRIQLRQACYATYGCPHCASKGRAKIGGHSKLSIQWVDRVSKELGLKFQHNENGGEALLELGLSEYRYATPVDGYNHRNRIICEYDGDYWHKRHDRRTKAYKNTVTRTNRMIELGYVVIHIWGKDYEAGYAETVFCKDQRGKTFARALGAEFIRTEKVEIL